MKHSYNEMGEAIQTRSARKRMLSVHSRPSRKSSLVFTVVLSFLIHVSSERGAIAGG